VLTDLLLKWSEEDGFQEKHIITNLISGDKRFEGIGVWIII